MYKKYIKRKERIILTAIDIIDELGIQGLTIRTIAQREKITESAIYRHFSSKKDIILAVLDKYSNFDAKIMNAIVEQEYSPIDGLFFFIKSFAEYYESYPQITSIIFLYGMDIGLYGEEIEKKMKQITERRRNFLSGLIQKGKENGEIASKFSTHELSLIICACIKEIILIWRKSSHEFSIKERILELVNKLLEV